MPCQPYPTSCGPNICEYVKQFCAKPTNTCYANTCANQFQYGCPGAAGASQGAAGLTTVPCPISIQGTVQGAQATCYNSSDNKFTCGQSPQGSVVADCNVTRATASTSVTLTSRASGMAVGGSALAAPLVLAAVLALVGAL